MSPRSGRRSLQNSLPDAALRGRRDSNPTAPEPSGASARPRFLDAVALALLVQRLGVSPREIQILEHLFGGMKETAIAAALKMSPYTLRTHVERLYRKLGVQSRTELVVRLYETFLEMLTDPGSPLEPICPRRSRGDCPFQN